MNDTPIKKTGWQKPPIPLKVQCAHWGVVFANMSAYRYAEGTEWICQCGKVFVVVSNSSNEKRLVIKEL